MSRIKQYSVGQLARQSGVTVRTLHHYDAIGLLIPATRIGNGRRLYDRDDVLRLQQILTYRMLGLALDEIAQILDDPKFDRRAALLAQRLAASQQIQRSKSLIRSIDEALSMIEDERTCEMDMKTLFEGFDPSLFEEEAKSRWGETEAWSVSNKRTCNYSQEDWARYHAQHSEICRELAALARTKVPHSDERAQELAKAYAELIDRWFYPCDTKQLGRLAEMYAGDDRFQQTFDSYGAGTAAFVIEAFRCSAQRAGESSL